MECGGRVKTSESPGICEVYVESVDFPIVAHPNLCVFQDSS
jgi:hypothetical protein